MKRLRDLRDFDPVPPGTCQSVEARLGAEAERARRSVGPVTLAVLVLATVSFGASAAVSIAKHSDGHAPSFRETRFERPAPATRQSQPATRESQRIVAPPTGPSTSAADDLSEKEENEMNVKQTVACAIAASALAAPAAAQPDMEALEPEPEIVYPTVQRLDFDPSLLTAEVTTPDQSYIHVRGHAKFECLIKVRSDFRDQLLRSVDDL